MRKAVDITTIWIRLALSDLKASRILYDQKQFRTSYFLFQQATEKANKAYALKFDLVKAEHLKEIGHDQFKIDRRITVRKIDELKQLAIKFQGTPLTIEKKLQALTKSLSTLDSLKNQDLLNLSSNDLNSLYKELTSLQQAFTKKYPQIKGLKNKVESKDGYSLAMFFVEWSREFYFIKLVIFACGILTVQHSTSTRYPEKEKNPFNIYTSKLPLIKKQPLFMNLLEEAIQKLIKHPKNPDLAKLIEKRKSVKNQKRL